MLSTPHFKVIYSHIVFKEGEVPKLENCFVIKVQGWL